MYNSAIIRRKNSLNKNEGNAKNKPDKQHHFRLTGEESIMKVAFLDRDGTIVKDYMNEHWSEVYELEFLPYSLKGMKNISNKGYEIIIITNQSIIDEGYISYSRYKTLSDTMCAKLSTMGIDLLDIFMCPHAWNQPCHCRKPETGMIEMAMQKYPGIDKTASFLAGDSIATNNLQSGANCPFTELVKHLTYFRCQKNWIEIGDTILLFKSKN